MIIYKATNKINGKIYIGQTVMTLEKRRNQHERAYKYKNTKNNVFARAINKYGKENFEWEVIDTGISIEDLNNKESYWISYYNSTTNSGLGYNMRANGDNKFLSEEIKQKIGMAQIGELNHMYGKKGLDNPTSKQVINLTDNIIYENATICSEKEGIVTSDLCAVCRGDRGSAKGKVFRYLDKEGNIIPIEVKCGIKNKRVLNIDTNQVFKTIKDAEIWLNHKSNNLATALRNGNGICYYCGYRWKYNDYELSEDEELPTKKPRKNSKKVINKTTGEIFPSITSVGANYRNLATALRKGSGKCIWRKQEWELF